MTNYKNNLPPYAEELILNEETISIQQILSQFKQPVPSNFVELEQLNWMCSTQGWKEPVCERYNCLIKGEWKQVDISHSLLNKLELEAKNIPYPVHISPTVINQGLDHYFAYNVEDEEEIFLQKSFTVENLKQNLSKLFQQIEELEGEKEENQETIKDLEKTKNDWKNEWLTEWRKNRTLTTEKDNLQNHLKSTLINSLFKNKRTRELNNCLSFLRSLLVGKNQEITNSITQRNNLQVQLNQTQTERNNSQNQTNHLNQQLTDANNLINNLQTLLGINDLNNLPVLPPGETLTSLLERPTPTQLNTQLNDLRREKDQELTTKNTQITNLTNQFNSLQTNYNNLNNKLTTTKNELERERGWWKKWMNDEREWVNYKQNSNEQVVAASKELISFLGAKVVDNYPLQSKVTEVSAILGANLTKGGYNGYYFYFRTKLNYREKEGDTKEEVEKAAKTKLKDFKSIIKEIYEFYKNQ